MIVDVIGGNQQAKKQDEIMHACDMFEPFKRFAIHSRIEVDAESPDIAITLVKAAYKHEKGFVIFAAILSESPTYFLEPGISVISTISNGRLGWLMFSDMLKKLGYTAVTDQTRKVISIANGQIHTTK